MKITVLGTRVGNLPRRPRVYDPVSIPIVTGVCHVISAAPSDCACEQISRQYVASGNPEITNPNLSESPNTLTPRDSTRQLICHDPRVLTSLLASGLLAVP